MPLAVINRDLDICASVLGCGRAGVSERDHNHLRENHLRSYRLLTTASLTTLCVALSGSVAVAAPDTVATAKADGATATAGDSRQKAVRLASGERLELMSDDTRSGSLFRVVPRDNAGSVGRYAYASVGGRLRVQPEGHPAQAMQLSTGARESAAAAATANTYPVKLTVDSPIGVSYKLLHVWDRQTWAYYQVKDEEYTPNGSVQLPAGDFFAVALYNRMGGAGSYLLTRTFRVTNAGTTVRFDESAAKETRIAVDDTTASRHTSAVWISVPGGLAGFAGGGAEKIYVTPFSVPGVSLRLHEILTKQGTSEYLPSPYRYDLYHSFDSTVPATPVVRVATAGLARTVTSIRGQARNTNGWLLTVPATGDWTGVYLESPVAIPGAITEYVTPDRSFLRLLFYRHRAHHLALKDRALPAGTTAGETIGAAPIAPRPSQSAASDRFGAWMSIYEYPSLSDAAGNLGLDNDAKVSVNLRSGDETYASATGLSPYQPVSATVPTVATVYQLDHTVTRATSWSRLSPEVRSEWRFLSASTSYPSQLPLVDANFGVAGLDTQNAAGAAPVRIDATATSRRPNAIPRLTGLEYSTDDGATWVALPVSGSEDRASAELTVPSTAAFVSLRTTAVDDFGGSLRRTVIRAFAGPASQYDETVGATRISNVVVNGGVPILLTPSGARQFTAKFTATDPSGIASGDVYLYRGSYRGPDRVLVSGSPADCTPVNATTSTCQATFRIDPTLSPSRTALTGAWQVAVRAHAKDGKSFSDLHAAASTSVLSLSVRRHAKLTTSATSKSVRTGKTITIKGALLQANVENGAYSGYPGQLVTLQFRKAGSSKYVTVKKVRLDRYGKVTVKVKGSASGYWRFVFAGTSTTAAATSGSAYVKVA
ncbi:hypothetical protein GA0074695_0577 [Micromonospora viridifaciens]|uniref:Uncharacterized protein n=1 Tax=Micromonospora viridifaciens TaxID=1881 RepID=A0A1C4UK70_MICVI|nr:hypothetical protein [Micromonospora viridifaciens]SCE72069.1 hypothetical protein GA0074695_0577 [Micromonospora viridifaciens]